MSCEPLPSGILIRVAETDDAVAIGRVQIETWRSAYRGIVSEPYLASLSPSERSAEWRDALADQAEARFTLVAHDEADGVIGFAAAGPERSGDHEYRAEIYALYVLPSHQGRSIGEKLFRAVADRLVVGGTRSMLLWVLEANSRARGFYEALGGKIVRKQPIEIGGVIFTEVAYGWPDLQGLLKATRQRPSAQATGNGTSSGKLAPGPLPVTGGITRLSQYLREDTHRFGEELRRAQAKLCPSAKVAPGRATRSLRRWVGVMERVQRYSRVIQVLAHLSVEAFLNEYGYLRFGEEGFEKNLRREGSVPKLKAMLRATSQVDLDDAAEIVVALRRLADRRNAIVHPRPELSVFDDSGVLNSITSKRLPPMDAQAAVAAVEDMERFFALFLGYDAEAATVISPLWPTAQQGGGRADASTGRWAATVALSQRVLQALRIGRRRTH